MHPPTLYGMLLCGHPDRILASEPPVHDATLEVPRMGIRDDRGVQVGTMPCPGPHWTINRGPAVTVCSRCHGYGDMRRLADPHVVYAGYPPCRHCSRTGLEPQ